MPEKTPKYKANKWLAHGATAILINAGYGDSRYHDVASAGREAMPKIMEAIMTIGRINKRLFFPKLMMILANFTPMPVSLETPITIPAAAQVTAIITADRPPQSQGVNDPFDINSAPFFDN